MDSDDDGVGNEEDDGSELGEDLGGEFGNPGDEADTTATGCSGDKVVIDAPSFLDSNSSIVGVVCVRGGIVSVNDSSTVSTFTTIFELFELGGCSAVKLYIPFVPLTFIIPFIPLDQVLVGIDPVDIDVVQFGIVPEL